MQHLIEELEKRVAHATETIKMHEHAKARAISDNDAIIRDAKKSIEENTLALKVLKGYAGAQG